MDKKKLIIIVILIAAVVGYFIWKNNAVVAAPTIPVTSPPPAPAGTSNDPGSSLPSPVSAQGNDIVTPVAIPAVAATFAAGTTDAQTQGSGTTSDPLGGLPSGFVAWVNSMGPQNRSRILTLIPQFTSDEINLMNTIVTQNLWGDASVAPSWNAFVSKYNIPVAGTFSNFSNFKAR